MPLPATTAGHLPKPQEVKSFLDDFVIGQDQTKKKLAVAVYNHYKRIQMNRMRNNEVELAKSQHSAHRADRLGQDAAGAYAGQDARRSLRHRGRHHAHRGRLRRRGCREHHPQAAAGRRRRCNPRPAGHHLYRRDRQDRPQGREPLHHPRRLRRRRAAGAAQDSRRHRGQRAAAGRTQASAPGVHRRRYHQHSLHLRRSVCGPGARGGPPRGQKGAGLQGDGYRG